MTTSCRLAVATTVATISRSSTTSGAKEDLRRDGHARDRAPLRREREAPRAKEALHEGRAAEVTSEGRRDEGLGPGRPEKERPTGRNAERGRKKDCPPSKKVTLVVRVLQRGYCRGSINMILIYFFSVQYYTMGRTPLKVGSRRRFVRHIWSVR